MGRKAIIVAGICIALGLVFYSLALAKNYKKVGMLADARRCLNNIIRAYPKTEWAARARRELAKL